jgi:hypothetical protein
MRTSSCLDEYSSACRHINSRKFLATSKNRSAVLTILFVIVVSSVTNAGMEVFGLINSEIIASLSGIPLGSKICAVSSMILECWRLRPVVSKSKTTYKTLS